MLPNTEDLKTVFLKDVSLLREKIQSFIDATYRTAEDAATHMFAEDDMLSRAAEAVMILKECREKLAAVAAAIPCADACSAGVGAFSAHVPEKSAQTSLKISPISVTYGIPYLVKFLQGTPNRFWLQMKGSPVEEIQESLKQFYSNAKPFNSIPALGSYLVCKQAGEYFRGKVVTTYENKGMFPEVNLLLVDIGEEATARLNELFKIEDHFCIKPAQGLLCSIYDLEPANGHWCLEDIMLFKALCENLVAIFHPPLLKDREPFSEFEVDYCVTLQSMKDGKALNVGSELVKMGTALPVMEQSVITPNTTFTQNSKLISENKVTSCQNLNNACKSSKCEVLSSSSELHKQVQEPVGASTPWAQTPFSENSTSDPNLKNSLRSSMAPSPYQHKLQNSADASTPNTTLKSLGFEKISSFQGNTIHIKSAEQEKEAAEILDAPPAIGEESNSFIVRPADELIMERFLSSLQRVTAAPSTTDPDESFVTARSGHNLCTVEAYSTKRESLPHFTYLEYEYGAVLQPRVLPEIDTSVENYLKFIISQIYSPSHFYVLPDDDFLALQDLTEILRETYENSQSVPGLRPEIGSYWVAQSEIQESWARAKVVQADGRGRSAVKSETNPENVCYVFFVDWGIFETVRVSSLRPLVKDIVDFPCTALRCHMAGIYPYNGSPYSDNWSDDATEKFRELVCSQIESTGLIDPSDTNNESISLVLLDEDLEENFSVNEHLVNLRLASSDVFQIFEVVTEPVKDFSDEGLSDWDPMRDDYYSPKNTLKLDPENYDSVTEGYVPKDEKMICRFFRAQGYCRKGIRCNQLHSQPHPSRFTEDETLVYVDVPSMPELPIGGMVSVQVTCVTNAYQFYAILPYGTRDLRFTFSVLDEDHNLEQLQIALQKEYNQSQCKHRCTVDPGAGEIVIARSPEDNKWYRGRVIEENHNDYLNIFFIDYGSRHEVHLTNICNPLPRFMHLPAQAVEMYLNGIDRSVESRSLKAKDALIRLVKERDLVAKVLFDVPYVCVDLYDTTGEEQIDIAAYLVKEKLVRPAPKMSCGTRCTGKMVPG